MSDFHREFRPLTNRDELAFRIWCAEVVDLTAVRRQAGDSWAKGELKDLAVQLLPIAYEFADLFLAERDRQAGLIKPG